MFGNSTFNNDPFFNQNTDVMSEFDRMDQMMSNFRSSFGMPTMMIGGPPINNDAAAGRMQRHQPQNMMGGNMFDVFGNMNRVFGDMDRMVSEMHNNPNAHCFSSSKVVSYSSDGSGEPKYYEASSQTTQGPGGVRQTRKSERNSVTGLDRMAVGHHIYDRGHVVERSRNRRTNEREEKNDFLNMDEEERDAFHREWQEKSRPTGRSIGQNPSHTHRQQRAINSAEYHRSNLERSRAHHRDRGGQQDGRRVHINSQPEEI